jgi:hypothetical protein
MAFISDPTIDVLRRVQQLSREPVQPLYDEKELREREAAAQAYAGEDQQHFVAYCNDCVRTSVDAMRQIRRMQRECWAVFNEEEPAFYQNKEPWQSKVVIPKPYGAVLFAQAIVRKAFDTQFLSIENEQDKIAERFWMKLMPLMLSKTFGDFPIQFVDSTGMSFAIGTSMEMIPVWRPGRGLRFVNVEPWKVHRDPDAITRKPQSGMYWIHQEYQDLWLIKKYGKDGRYVNVDGFSKDVSPDTHKYDPQLTPQAIDRRKGMMWHRSDYRAMILTSEFWGTVLSKRGELLLPSATYTIAGDNVVRLPKPSPYQTLRWPGMSFSVLPHLLRYDGRGLVHGIRTLWNFMNGFMCLHNDALNWAVNPTSEIDISALVDHTDVDDWPGKKYLTRGTTSGNQVVRTHERRQIANEVLAVENFCQQRFEEGTFITSLVQGLPGYRAEVTAREAAQSLEQAMAIFGLIGSNLEAGALDVLLAATECIRVNMTYNECVAWMGKDPNTGILWADYFRDFSSPTGLRIPGLTTGAFHVSGMSALMRDWEVIRSIRDTILPLCEPNSAFLPFINKYGVLKALEHRLNLVDEHVLIPLGMAIPIMAQQLAANEAELQAAIAMNQSQVAGAEMQAQVNAATTPAQIETSQARAHQATREALAAPFTPPEALPEAPTNEGAP